ncbi:TetR family transcriptional regulator [Streptomyces sp. CSDS2]|uniref:TetR/AcrR family transcriptional regulator n=1 Tax=Streptomyces sp. CSDS2 TaxID=3055051 RepID=UPI0025B1C5FB|nr:TetR family transcriptional regulator [Streptomyces sp. CSDS2]MDN3259866.1 TetR family transcriptional regulator [Streptomyces sp. CSDS2]
MHPDETAQHETPSPVQSTRQWLIEVAQREISERGLAGVSLRSIAARAEVDPSLVRHYFGSKQTLLEHALNISLDLDDLVAEALRGTPAKVGRRTVKLVLGLCDDPRTAARTLVNFSVPLGDPEYARPDTACLRPVFQRIAERVAPDRHDLRAALVTAQVTALVMGRYLVHDPVLAAAAPQDLVRVVGRAVQEQLTGPLPDDGSAGDGTAAGEEAAAPKAAGPVAAH